MWLCDNNNKNRISIHYNIEHSKNKTHEQFFYVLGIITTHLIVKWHYHTITH